MLDPAATPAPTAQVPVRPPRAVLTMRSSDRMAGSVPAWVPPQGGRDSALSRIENAGERHFDDVLADALSYGPGGHKTRPIDEQPFGFGDLVDMVNPLHHIPLVGHVYRNITGDQIRPIAQIVGGAVFGGAAGAAGSLVNVIIEEETGRDITGNVIAMVRNAPDPEAPATRLAAAGSPVETLPGAALSFAALDHKPATEKPKMVWKFNE